MSTGRWFACWTYIRRITLCFTGNLSHKDLQLDWVICCLTLCIPQQMRLCAWFTSLRLTYRSEQWWWVSSPSWYWDHHKSEDVWHLHGIGFCLEEFSFKNSDICWHLPRHLLIILTQISAVLSPSFSSFQRCCMSLMCCPPVSFGTFLTARLFKGSTSGNGFCKGQQMAVTVAKCCITLYNNSCFL